MTGILLGLVFGGVQLYLLILGTASLGSSRIAVWPFVVQFFCPLAGLLLCGMLRPQQLAICGISMSAVLIVGAVVRWIACRRKDDANKEA